MPTLMTNLLHRFSSIQPNSYKPIASASLYGSSRTRVVLTSLPGNGGILPDFMRCNDSQKGPWPSLLFGNGGQYVRSASDPGKIRVSRQSAMNHLYENHHIMCYNFDGPSQRTNIPWTDSPVNGYKISLDRDSSA